MLQRLFCAMCVLFFLQHSLLHAGGPKVHVVVGPNPSRLEQFAAKELAAQLQQLFEAQVTIAETAPAAVDHLILLGSPASNPSIPKATWPKLTDQGHLLRSIELDGRKALLIGGSSPVATLWAVYELGHRFGIRYMLDGDILPAEQPAFKLTGIDVLMEPTLRLRTWRTINDFPIGPESWGLTEQKKLLGQLAKLKFNRIMLAVYPWQPFAHYEFKGIKKQTGMLWYGYRYPVGGDTAGRGAFKGAAEFINPDFEGKTNYVERTQSGVTLARGIIDYAHDLGMSAGLSISPLEFPKEFAAVLPKAKVIHGLEKLTIGPGPLQPPDDPLLKELVTTQIRAYLDTYPTIDALYLSLPEFPDWIEHHAKAWQRLDDRTGVAKVADLKQLIESARRRKLTSSGARGVRALQGNISALEFFHNLLDDPNLMKRKDGRPVEVTIADVDPALLPFLDRVLPKGVNALHFIDYTARRVAATKHLLQPTKTPSSLILTLADDNVGVLPQIATHSLHPLLSEMRKHDWQGYSTRYWIPGDLHPTVHYLARSSFDAKLTPQAAYGDLFDPICGEGVSPRLIKAFDMIEKATETIDQNDHGFSFPVPGMMMRHYNAEPLPPWWKAVTDLYAGAMDEMYRANTRARDGVKARPYMVYYAKRLEFAYFYMTSLESLRLAGQAKAKGDTRKQFEMLQSGTEALYNGLSAYSEVARDQSDRGVIAVVNEYGYRPMRNELDVARKALKK